MKHTLVMLLAAAMCVFSLTACGGKDSSSASAESESVYVESQADSSAEETSTVASQAEEPADSASQTEEASSSASQAEETTDGGNLAEELAAKVTFAAMGVDEAGETVYLAECGDAFTVFVVLDPSTGNAVSFVGPEEKGQAEDGTPAVTITDETNGLAMTYTVLEMDQENGIITINTGDGGKAVLEKCEPIEVTTAIQNIDNYANLIA